MGGYIDTAKAPKSRKRKLEVRMQIYSVSPFVTKINTVNNAGKMDTLHPSSALIFLPDYAIISPSGGDAVRRVGSDLPPPLPLPSLTRPPALRRKETFK